MAATDLITIVVADDQRLIRDGIRVILDNEPGMSVIGEASDGLEAVSVVARLHPRVVLMDIQICAGRPPSGRRYPAPGPR